MASISSSGGSDAKVLARIEALLRVAEQDASDNEQRHRELIEAIKEITNR